MTGYCVFLCQIFIYCFFAVYVLFWYFVFLYRERYMGNAIYGVVKSPEAAGSLNSTTHVWQVACLCLWWYLVRVSPLEGVQRWYWIIMCRFAVRELFLSIVVGLVAFNLIRVRSGQTIILVRGRASWYIPMQWIVGYWCSLLVWWSILCF